MEEALKILSFPITLPEGSNFVSINASTYSSRELRTVILMKLL